MIKGIDLGFGFNLRGRGWSEGRESFRGWVKRGFIIYFWLKVFWC